MKRRQFLHSAAGTVALPVLPEIPSEAERNEKRWCYTCQFSVADDKWLHAVTLVNGNLVVTELSRMGKQCDSLMLTDSQAKGTIETIRTWNNLLKPD